MAESPHLVIADGHALCYQAFYALPPMSAPDGRPTQVVYGVLGTLFRLLKALKPTHLIVAFDAPGPTFRHDAYADYKIHRAPAPEGLHAQIDLLKDVLKAMGVAQSELKGYEADDLLGTLAVQAESMGHRVSLVTSDKDALQLLSDRVSIYDPRKDRRLGPAELLAEKGLTPAQVPDFLALTGDSSDNVPGVPGIGPKTAQKLLASAGSLEALLKDPEAHATGKTAEALKSHVEAARASLHLTRIDLKAPVQYVPEEAPAPHSLAPQVPALFRTLGFQRFLSELPAAAQAGLFDAPALAPQTVPVAPAKPTCEHLSGPALAQALKTLASPVACATAGDSSRLVLADAGHALEADPAALVAEKGFWKAARLDGHDLKPVLVALRRAGLPPEAAAAAPRVDTQLAAYLLDPESAHRLEDLAREHLGREVPPATPPKAEAGTDDPAARATARARAALDLAPVLLDRLEKDGLKSLFTDLEIPLLPVLAEMEVEGIRLDAPALARLSAEIGERLATLEKDIHAAAGEPFNIGSPKQLGHVLFEVLGLPHGRKGKTGYSTDAEVLEELAPQHPLPALVLEYRQLEKLRNTYVDALPTLVDPADGRLHTSFNQAVAATGRLSSSRPNLQNIPIRTPLGRRIREAFLPHGPGDVLLTADYSQIELRILAHCSGDPALCEAFANGEDIHAAAAARIHGVPLADVTDAMRDFAKTVNFSVIYGKTAFTLAKDLHKPVKEAQAFIDAYFATFAGVKAFIDRTVAEARERGFVATLSGRRRPVPFLASPNPAQRMAAERVAVNTVIQGSAADLIKMAMLRVDRALRDRRLRARILLQIHDELVLNVPKSETAAVEALVTQAMTGAMTLAVPLTVNTATGETWREAA